MEEKKEPIETQNKPTQPLDDVDDVATAEEMAEYARQSAERRAMKKKEKTEEEEPHEGQYGNTENQEDPYLEPDPTLPWVKYEENEYLTRGCCRCPQPYETINETEINSCSKVPTTNWLKGIRQPGGAPFDVVEVRFKHNRKDYFKLPEGLEVNEGDLVAVEGQPGHDVGIVSLTGEVCRIQMRNKKIDPDSENIRKLFRRAKPTDIEKWKETLQEEHAALLKTRQIAERLGLVMKVNDVEIQGDRSKAIFYYTADDRVDFRTLIKVLAEEFHLRIEMKQIGVRQEASKVGGIGTCGRELCCSTWLTNFKSVTTNAAKTQQILPNPQKLAGQCGKLKCCLNFEYEVYVDALKKFPPANTAIRFQKGLALYKKTDVFRGIMWYAYEGENDLHALPAEKVKEIIEMNQNQKYPEKIEDFQVELMSTAALAQETSHAEFEQELRKLVEGGDGVVTEDNKKQQPRNDRRERNDRNDHNRGEHRDRGDRNNRQEQNERIPRQEQGERQEHIDRPNRPNRNNRQEGSQPRNEQRPHPNNNNHHRIEDRRRSDRNNRTENDKR